MTNTQVAHDIIRDHQRACPVDVVTLDERLGLKVFADELPPGVSGQILKKPAYGSVSGYSIIVNSKEAPERQRFTVAHEIAHFILHRGKIGDGIQESALYRAVGFDNRQESEANNMAVDILMPWHLLVPIVDAAPKTPADLAKIFGVSEVAMSIRLGLPT